MHEEAHITRPALPPTSPNDASTVIPCIVVVIPALNEAQSIGQVIDDIPSIVQRVIVVDNGSTDDTAAVAAAHGATLVREPRRGYGSACLAGIAEAGEADVIVFLDADYADDPAELPRVIEPIVQGRAELVIGSRRLGHCERGALTFVQRWGNALACRLIRFAWGVRFTDLGPFRAVRRDALERLSMDDRTYGWTVQMQARATGLGVRCVEVPVNYRRRIGRSKISGTVRGVIAAGTKILATIWREARHHRRRRPAVEHLIVLTRYPEPGRTKTRMIPKLGPEGAADLQRDMTRRTLDWAEHYAAESGATIEVRFAGGDEAAMAAMFGPHRRYVPQGDGDLGQRMERALLDAFHSGAARAVIIGCDCPAMTGHTLHAAFDRLADHDVVIGPATDGGYYLIGARRETSVVAGWFDHIDWGGPNVLDQTLRRVAAGGAAVALLSPRSDIDRPDDLPAWQVAGSLYVPPRNDSVVSVIIPARNEAARIEATITAAQQADRVEVIVVDGQSDDDTAAVARRAGATVIASAPGRAVQMNAGAAVAAGELLLFLHADTLLPPRFDRHVRAALADVSVAAGAFTFALDDCRRSLRWIAWWTNRRSRRGQMPYGDQGIFIRRDRFESLGGYRPMPIMEDYDLIRRARRTGRIVTVRAPAVTSARRWLARGVWRTTAVHQLTVLAYRLGIPPAAIARFRR